MNSKEIEIAYKLKNYHRGKGNAITYKNLAAVLDLNERELRNIVSDLVTYRQLPIATDSQAGYYWTATDDEYQHAYNEIMSRVKALAKRAKSLRIGYFKNKNVQKPEQLQML